METGCIKGDHDPNRNGKAKTTEEGMATDPSILAWRISWTEEPGGLQSTELQRVRHD